MNDLQESKCDHIIIYNTKRWLGVWPPYKLGRCTKCGKLFKKYKDKVEEVEKEKDEW